MNVLLHYKFEWRNVAILPEFKDEVLDLATIFIQNTYVILFAFFQLKSQGIFDQADFRWLLIQTSSPQISEKHGEQAIKRWVGSAIYDQTSKSYNGHCFEQHGSSLSNTEQFVHCIDVAHSISSCFSLKQQQYAQPLWRLGGQSHCMYLN